MVEPEDLKQKLDDEVDEAEEESFPASDPPSYGPLHAGTPDQENGQAEKQPRKP